MFDYTSRYASIPNATYVAPNGRMIAYKRRRFLPQGDLMPLLAEVAVLPDERLDLLTYRTLGDPLQFWRIADANNAVDPFELVGQAGDPVRIPVPQPG